MSNVELNWQERNKITSLTRAHDKVIAFEQGLEATPDAQLPVFAPEAINIIASFVIGLEPDERRALMDAINRIRDQEV